MSIDPKAMEAARRIVDRYENPPPPMEIGRTYTMTIGPPLYDDLTAARALLAGEGPAHLSETQTVRVVVWRTLSWIARLYPVGDYETCLLSGRFGRGCAVPREWMKAAPPMLP